MGTLLEPVQIDSKNGVLTLFGPRSQDIRSPQFETNYYPYLLVAYNLLPGQTATLMSVAQIQGTTRESVFKYNGNDIVLTADSPIALVAFSGMYRLVMNSPVQNAIVKAYPQVRSKSVSPIKSDEVNSILLTANVLSGVESVLYKAKTVTVYELGPTDTVDIYAVFEAYTALLTTLNQNNNTYLLDKTCDYALKSNVDTLVTVRPNYIEFNNPYINKGEKGDTADINIVRQGYVTPLETPDGVLTTFTLPEPYIAGSLIATLNGLVEPINEIDELTFDFIEPPEATDIIYLDYLKEMP